MNSPVIPGLIGSVKGADSVRRSNNKERLAALDNSGLFYYHVIWLYNHILW